MIMLIIVLIISIDIGAAGAPAPLPPQILSEEHEHKILISNIEHYECCAIMTVSNKH